MTEERDPSERSAESARPFVGLTQRDIWFGSMEHTPGVFARFLGRLFLSLFQQRIVGVKGLEHVSGDKDPFILALNHNSRLEAILIPTLLIHHRKGRLIRFLGDWNFFLIPFIASYYRKSRVIIVTRKDARPKFLNRLKPLFEQELPVLTRARLALEAGDSVGIFPEGRMNRNPSHLLRGSPGAARLSLESGKPIVPVGIRFPDHDPEKPIGDLEPMTFEIGAPLAPPMNTGGERAPAAAVRAWHDRLMSELARLSGKQWPPPLGGS